MKPAIVLVHGAFAESASWDQVIDSLAGGWAPVIAAANPLRGPAADAAAVGDLIATVDGPVVLVGPLLRRIGDLERPRRRRQGHRLVYVCAFAPGPGETCNALAQQFPGSTLASTLKPVQRGDGTTDLYIVPERFHQQFCADLPTPQAARMAATQRPVTLEALTEPSGPRPLWRELPSWFVIGDQDRTIPAALQHFMAERAGARRALAIPGGSHAAVVSHPEETAKMILEAAAESRELP